MDDITHFNNQTHVPEPINKENVIHSKILARTEFSDETENHLEMSRGLRSLGSLRRLKTLGVWRDIF